jgi:hypothetical protein
MRLLERIRAATERGIARLMLVGADPHDDPSAPCR